MDRFSFTSDPAWVTVGEGISIAFRHWRATVLIWALPVLGMGLAGAIALAAASASLEANPPIGIVTETYEIDYGALLAAMLPTLVIQSLVLGTLGILAQWVYLGLAVGGLRGTEMSPGWIVRRGLRSAAVGLILLAVMALLAAIPILALSSHTSGLAILLALVLLPAWIWILVRLTFWTLAVFDGAGILDGLRVSWALSAGSLGRMVGWALAAAGIGLVVRLALGIALIPLGDGNPVRAGIDAAAIEAFAVFQLFMLAVLYESQRRRSTPGVEPRPALRVPAWTVPQGTSPDAAAADPGGPPPLPAPPRDPWRG